MDVIRIWCDFNRISTDVMWAYSIHNDPQTHDYQTKMTHFKWICVFFLMLHVALAQFISLCDVTWCDVIQSTNEMLTLWVASFKNEIKRLHTSLKLWLFQEKREFDLTAASKEKKKTTKWQHLMDVIDKQNDGCTTRNHIQDI